MMLLQAGGVSIPVKCESGASRSTQVPSTLHTAIDGTRWAARVPRPATDLRLSFSVSRPEEHAALLALLHGEYGPGPYRLVDSTAAVTNALSAHASLLGTFVGSGITVSTAPLALPDGGIAGRHLVGAAGGVLVTPGWGHAALAPPAGYPVTVSAYVTSGTGRVRVRPVWFTDASSAYVTGTLRDVPVPAAGTVIRAHATQTVPATVTPSGGSAAPVARVGFQVYEATRLARPAVSHTADLLPWGVGASPRAVILDDLSADAILALSEPSGLRASTVTLTAREVGPA